MREAGVQMDELDQAGELMAAIRYQVFRPDVTTMGPCPDCGTGSRGSGRCADCLGQELDDVVGAPTGARFVSACRRLREVARNGLDDDDD